MNPIVWLFEDFSTLQLVGAFMIVIGLIVLAAAQSGFADPGNTTAVNGAIITMIISGAFAGLGLLLMILPRFYRDYKYRKLL